MKGGRVRRSHGGPDSRGDGSQSVGGAGAIGATWLGVIADDITGATDVAAHLVREGVATVVQLGVPEDTAVVPHGTGAIVVALKTRSIDPGEAVRQSLRAHEWLAAAGASHRYFKYCSTFDSTARGNIGPVLDALAEAVGASLVVVAPSAPENGRTVYQGKLFVRESLLEESPLRDHPLNPMRDSDLGRLLRPQSRREPGAVDWQTVVGGADRVQQRFAQLMSDGRGTAVADALTNDDLDTIAAAIHSVGHPLSSGSAGLAAALARTVPTRFGDGGQPIVPRGRALILSGSSSPATRAQVERYRESHPTRLLDPLALAEDSGEIARAIAFVRANRDDAPLLHSSVDRREIERAQARLGVERAARMVEDALSAVAVAARADGVRAFIVAGGETSGAVTQALDVRVVRIGAEVATGVPWCATAGADPLSLLLKSGNFGDADFFELALARVRR